MNYNQINLISANYIKGYSSVTKNVEDKILLAHIQESQNIDLKYLLGDELFNLIIEQYNDYKEAGGTSAPNAKNTYIEPRLLDLREQLKPFLLYRTLWNAKYSLSIHITNKGVTEQHSDNTDNVDIKIVEKMGADWKNKSENYMMLVVDFLTKNAATYPEYTTDCATSAGMVFKNPIKLI